jgi:hypothetical protein
MSATQLGSEDARVVVEREHHVIMSLNRIKHHSLSTNSGQNCKGTMWSESVLQFYKHNFFADEIVSHLHLNISKTMEYFG